MTSRTISRTHTVVTTDIETFVVACNQFEETTHKTRCTTMQGIFIHAAARIIVKLQLSDLPFDGKDLLDDYTRTYATSLIQDYIHCFR
ncbi:hypothetical protein C0J52_14408 [Blattella germanica]|nr:hypothetical protein C0J52_14408 [Blattella germanica]